MARQRLHGGDGLGCEAAAEANQRGESRARVVEAADADHERDDRNQVREDVANAGPRAGDRPHLTIGHGAGPALDARYLDTLDFARNARACCNASRPGMSAFSQISTSDR